MTPAETLAKSKQLDRFLGKAVTDIKTTDRAAMDRFAELAARSAALHRAAGERADRFEARLDNIPELLERAFAPQEAKLDDLELGASVLEKSLESMIGHNGAPLQVLPPVVQPSLPVVDPVAEPQVQSAPVAEPVVPPPVPLDPTANGNAA